MDAIEALKGMAANLKDREREMLHEREVLLARLDGQIEEVRNLWATLENRAERLKKDPPPATHGSAP